jgi:3-phosphoshikimate 1-carboxyvinyltransferase
MKPAAILPLTNPINKTINIPGSKSYTNRALIIAGLAKGKTILDSTSLSNDSLVLMKALKKLGIKIKISGTRITIAGQDGQFKPFKGVINVGAAGTTMRFLTSLCAFIPALEIILKGNERMNQRPITELVIALKKLGAKITYLQKKGYPPLKIKGTSQIINKRVWMDGSVSSQYFTALMLISPLLKDGLIIKVKNKQVSPSYIDMTISILKDFGIKVINKNYQEYQIKANQSYQAQKYVIEVDASGCSYFWALAALTASKIKIKNINPFSAQGDVEFPDLLAQMGCRVIKNSGQKWIQVQGVKKLQPLHFDMENMPDTAQTLAVIAAFAQGQSKITGLSTLRIKETDRLAALQNELRKMNIKTKIGPDYIIVHGASPKGAVINTYQDHRMAMAFAIAGTKIPGIKITDPEVVNKSFPEFWQKLKSLGVQLR